VTGESNELTLTARGPWVCISPWNFPLAIFIGQVAAALATGNTVLAKPAEQTPAVALEAVKLMHCAGVPAGALQLMHGPGETVGAALVAQPGVAGVVFTGSTQVAKHHQPRAGRQRRPHRAADCRDRRHQRHAGGQHRVARAGGRCGGAKRLPIAGQRCSALRLLCVHEGIADGVIEMIWARPRTGGR
jgi:RHH-type proline utilization regulon transcriptional repressor/proline dehydrogenase/delta 1-pyrroline-5-carboxylate dehydrogenase